MPIHRFFLGVSNQISHSETTKLEACIASILFDQLLYKRAINAGCNFLTQTVNKMIGIIRDCMMHLTPSLMRVAFMQAR